ncbi:MAG: ectoine/hydroxyectoine ABC transporter permease subunit EhuD [Albidovulum sp.]|nr:ectoine/hydroxyectoine ABC transporter permease subunit EhuD [Albidovulum sp.]MDE0534172.1 ectoine/hydroxyectoine ABC transporter permease subunit EhuD [Albidovulum sp.]
MMDWRWDFTFDVVLPRLWEAAGITVYATVVSFAFALVGGLILMLLKMSAFKPISFVASEVIEFIRGTPLLVQIFFLFFVLPQVGITLPPLTTGIMAIAIYNSALTAEVYRAGLQAVPRGQWEAAVALNLSPYRTFRKIIIPQSLPPIVPALGNYLIAIFKETPLLSFVAVGEIMHASKLIGSEYYRFNEAVTIAGIFFLVMSLVSAALVRAAENYVKRSILH